MTEIAEGVASCEAALTDLTRDVFLGGGLQILQPRHGYRAATDPVFLAASVPASPGETVLELGCGVGVALLALGRRVEGLHLTGVERQSGYADLARRNAQINGIAAEIHAEDLADLPLPLKRGFDHVLVNPPFYPAHAPVPQHPERAAGRHEETPLALWIDVALKRLAPGGHLTLIHLADRLPEILALIGARAGATAVRPLAARGGRPAGRILLQARKGARGKFRLLAPLIIHEGAQHIDDRDDFTPEAQQVLRYGAALDWQ
ncbi:tRNA1(Val) (adenine(37)-N6)-methyltransferase [Pararhodobacter oceanensis]|uniref:tRNA1(Val) (adenine(37)-N6)-methyltransferase n=1 Tax=Pararhodobacter oceanensis TaxID=2172121 RepID=UPI003A936D14